MSRAKILISVGSGAIFLSVTLLAWVNDSARPAVIPEGLGLLLLVPGMLALVAGSIAFAPKKKRGRYCGRELLLQESRSLWFLSLRGS
jgi:hypothetical protein